MDLMRRLVSHRKYGSGTITGLRDDVVTVFFDQYGCHSFRFPDVFAAELKLKDDALQRELEQRARESAQ